MKRSEITRREFSRLTAAAFGGVVAGSMAGCNQNADKTPPSDTAAGSADSAPAANGPPETASNNAAGSKAAEETEEVSVLLQEPHVCRGLNTCKGKGAGGDNACAGQGTCATVEAHSCASQNACKGQGGCGGEQGTNDCKGMGGCGVPLEHNWEDVRAKFEKAMQDAGKTFGDAPEAA